MKKVAHVLQPVKRTGVPKWVIFFDTETTEVQIDANTKQLVFKIGHAILTRKNRKGTYSIVSECAFDKTEQFYDWLSGSLKDRERYFITAHNVSFDARITDIFSYFDHQGYTRTSFIESGLNFIARFRRRTTSVVLLNNMQFFNMSLKRLGENIGFEKGYVDFKSATAAELAEYCRRDVLVMLEAWNKLATFVLSNDLGKLGFTLASQSMIAFRRRFMHDDILIHDNENAIKLERESYHGGRVEMFQYGETPYEPTYYLDVNSMYPYVMRECQVPTKLVRYLHSADVDIFERSRHDYGYIVEAEIEIDAPILPLVYNNKLCFPVGKLKGVFVKPEFERALVSGRLLSVGRLALYEEKVIFRPFVDFFYEKRLEYKKAGNEAFSFICKLFLNSLYGKFGQRNLVFKKVAESTTIPDGMWDDLDMATGKWRKFRVYKGVVEIEVGYEEGYNSFVAIASYVASHARLALYNYIDKAGIENVLYCDTDSIFCNSIGYMRLLPVIDSGKLGSLKIEGTAMNAAFYGAKRYRFGDTIKSKGIRPSAIEIAPNVFKQEKWLGFKGALRSGKSNNVLITDVTKTLHSGYSKGTITDSGRVLPFHLG